ncbi:MAG: hypothetical protein ACFFAE_22700, partial [Candidatus Hodarchaeota archaeon]
RLMDEISQTNSITQLTHPPFIELTVKDATTSSLFPSALVEIYNETGFLVLSENCCRTHNTNFR